MEAERPGDANMPPDDDQDSTGDHAAHPGNAEPETRGREEYYSELRVEVSREESAAARQVTAEEQAAAEKWQVKVAESRWMWSEYQSKWPPAERSSPDKPTASPGSWHGDGIGEVGREVQPLAVAGDQLREARLVDRHSAAQQLLDPGLVDVDAPDLAAELGEPGGGDQPYVPGTDHRDRFSR